MAKIEIEVPEIYFNNKNLKDLIGECYEVNINYKVDSTPKLKLKAILNNFKIKKLNVDYVILELKNVDAKIKNKKYRLVEIEDE